MPSSARFTKAVWVPSSFAARGLIAGGLALACATGRAAAAPRALAQSEGEGARASLAVSPPSLTQKTLQLRARAQRRLLSLGGLIEDESGHVVRDRRGQPEHKNGNALGHFIAIENEAALRNFHESLRELRRAGPRGKKVRIAAYGASHTQGDYYTGYLRYYLQSRFGNGGLGFMPLGVRRTWSRRFGFKLDTRNLSVEWAQARGAPDHGLFGLSGAAATSDSAAYAKIFPSNLTERELRASHYELFYLATPGGADITVSVDGEAPVQLRGSAPRPEPRYYSFVRHPGWHTVRLHSKGPGPSRWFGLSIEQTGPGVVVDTLGIRGTRAANMLEWDRSLWFEHLRRRRPSLVMLAYGTNEAVDEGKPIEQYAANLDEVLRRTQLALPEASCLLVGPGDFPQNDEGRWVPRPRLRKIIETQRRVSIARGCGFWDSYAFMGGSGSMDRWVKAKPRLGARDHIHFTVRGYVRMGMALGDALLRTLDADQATAAVSAQPSDARAD